MDEEQCHCGGKIRKTVAILLPQDGQPLPENSAEVVRVCSLCGPSSRLEPGQILLNSGDRRRNPHHV